MSLIQAIQRAQNLTEQTGRSYIVLEEKFARHKPSYHVTDGIDWYRAAERSPEHAARYTQIYP